MVEALTIRPRQQECIDSVVAAWRKKLPVVVSAPTGAGKTRIAIAAAVEYGAEYIILIGPKASLPQWAETLELVYDESEFHTATYAGWTFCGTKKAPKKKQPYLYSINRKGKGIDYYASDEWKEFVDNYKVVLIVDEFQMIKNPSLRTFAVAASSRYITLGNNDSRTIFLSYTPSDKLEMTSIHMYAMGIVCKDEDKGGNKSMIAYDRKKRKWIATGLRDTFRFLESLGEPTVEYKDALKDILSRGGKSIHKEANQLAGNIFLDVIKKHIVFSCKPEFMENEELRPIYGNLYCRVSDRTASAVVKVLRKTSSFYEEKNEIKFKHLFGDGEGKNNFGKLVRIHESLEKIKCDIYTMLTLGYFEENPTGKVIIMVQFLENLANITNTLREQGYGVVNLEGKMSMKKRTENIKAFQEHNTKIQVLVGTIQTGGVSVSLHDTSEGGRFPRLILIPPCPRVIDVVQSSGRVFRDGVTSRATINIVYTADKDVDDEDPSSLENKFYVNIWEKSKNIKRYHAVGQEDPLPCDYDTYITDDIYHTFLDDSDYEDEEEGEVVEEEESDNGSDDEVEEVEDSEGSEIGDID